MVQSENAGEADEARYEEDVARRRDPAARGEEDERDQRAEPSEHAWQRRRSRMITVENAPTNSAIPIGAARDPSPLESR